MLRLEMTIKGLEKGEKLTEDKMKRVLMRSMFKMEELAIQKAPVDRGDIRQKITLFPHILADEYILSSRSPHSAPMEFGTRPFYAPIKPLSAWAGRKLGDSGLGYAIQAKIAKEGITAQPFMRPAKSEVLSYWMPEFRKQEFEQ